jgi:DNA-binding transcriptional MerR regulator
MSSSEQLYSEKQAARIWGYSPRTLRAWRKAELIEFTRTPTGRVRYTLDQILAGKTLRP